MVIYRDGVVLFACDSRQTSDDEDKGRENSANVEYQALGFTVPSGQVGKCGGLEERWERAFIADGQARGCGSEVGVAQSPSRRLLWWQDISACK